MGVSEFNLRARTLDFARKIIRLYVQMPRVEEARILGRQMLKSGTSVGAHYREAIRARSNAEYCSKLTGGLMELDETDYWLELIQLEIRDLEPMSRRRKEADELMAIFVTLIKKAKADRSR